MSLPNEIIKLLEAGAKFYVAKKYEESVECYGKACGRFSELNNGEEDPELLYLYGKALYQIAVSNNGLFGGADEQKHVEEEGKEEKEEEDDEEEEEEDDDDEKKKGDGLFQFSGDAPLAEENDDDHSHDHHYQNDKDQDNKEEQEQEEQEQEEQEQEQEQEMVGDEEQEKQEKEDGEQEEQQSDFEIAWEILDLSRSLYDTKLSSATEESDIKSLKKKLSDIHDLLGEISLETENFKQATEDFKQLLKLRESIYEFKSNLISEAHYKLALALEFNISDNDAEQDEMKKGAIEHLTKAIESIKQRDKKNDELIKELEIKLQELKKDPNEQFDLQKREILKGILGEVTGDAKQLQAINTPINDLTSIVKKRKAQPDNEQNKKPKN